MPSLTLTATCVARTGVTGDGVIVAAGELADRFGWLSQIGTRATALITESQWNPQGLGVLASGYDVLGQPLPGKAWMAGRRLGWSAKQTLASAKLYVPDRVHLVAEEHAVRLLRAAAHRRNVTAAIIETWPDDEDGWRNRKQKDWDALVDAIETRGVEFSLPEARNRTRSIAAFLKDNERLPADLTEMEEPPEVAAVILLAAADKQLVGVDRLSQGRAVLRVQLPLTAEPASRRDWAWVSVEYTLPPRVIDAAVLSTPTVRLTKSASGRAVIRIDQPYTLNAPKARMTGTARETDSLNPGHDVAVAGDWGVNCLLAAVTGSIADNRADTKQISTDGRPYYFSAKGMAAKAHRLRIQNEKLTGKIARQEALLANQPEGSERDRLKTKHAVLKQELDRVAGKRTRLNRAIAKTSARWLIDLALHAGATAIFIEDLRDHESRGLGKKQNVRCSNQVKAMIVGCLRFMAARDGLVVMTVPARGTSKFCSRCQAKLTSRAAPNSKKPGHSWKTCPQCGCSADRDHAAAERILVRGLAGQHSAFLDRARNWRISVVHDISIAAPDPAETKAAAEADRAQQERRAACKAARRRKTDKQAERADRAAVTAATAAKPDRAKSGPTPARPQRPRKAVFIPSKKGRVRLTGPVPAAEEPHGSGVQRPAGTASSAPAEPCRSTVHRGTDKPARARRKRRTQGRGFHPLCHPTWIPAQRAEPAATALHRV